ncbi:hypothetical protein [Thiomicrospira sp. ALE5]|uniref:hypothetical protein n=1 Tax=Thiomicrospira sp. ALE5 TaxID=748650 RepID=UPI0008EFC2BE|nr:hypothetical protein [Thiomicrospira sp. ALE5]SFR53291.1 hypothetical protein SAMN03092900_0836 [Thiomicrospira sp. ALE5]
MANQPHTPPAAESLIQRLKAVDINLLNPQEVEKQVLGKRVWLHTFTFPVTVTILGLVTLFTSWLLGNMLYGFIIALILIWFLGKSFESYENDTQRQVQLSLQQAIEDIEGEHGLLIHFSAFLPKRYGALLIALRKKQFHYILQYYQAIVLLQRNLNEPYFIQYWHTKHPELDPELNDNSDPQKTV